MATTAPGPSSISRMSRNIFHSLRKHNKDTLETNGNAFFPPNRQHYLTYHLHLSHNCMQFSSGHMIPPTHSTQIKLDGFHNYPVKAVDIN
jgi:hypothetical protein